jgi:hypothetical protein
VKKQTIRIMLRLKELASENYEMKVLIYEVLNLSLLKTFPQLPEVPFGKLTIIPMVFKVKAHKWL